MDCIEVEQVEIRIARDEVFDELIGTSDVMRIDVVDDGVRERRLRTKLHRNSFQRVVAGVAGDVVRESIRKLISLMIDTDGAELRLGQAVWRISGFTILACDRSAIHWRNGTTRRHVAHQAVCNTVERVACAQRVRSDLVDHRRGNPAR